MHQFNTIGYVVAAPKDLPNKELTTSYCGIGNYDCWPLDTCKDKISILLNNEAEEKWFGYQNIGMEIIPDISFINLYLNHCEDLQIEVQIFQVETNFDQPPIIQAASIDGIEKLGFDCVGTVNYSYLNDDDGYNLFKNELSEKHIKFNDYGLFYSEDDVNEYIKIRRNALENGIQIEDYWIEKVAFYSIVNSSSITAMSKLGV